MVIGCRRRSDEPSVFSACRSWPGLNSGLSCGRLRIPCCNPDRRLTSAHSKTRAGSLTSLLRCGEALPLAVRALELRESSPNGKPLLIVSNEVSGSLRVFEIAQKK